MAHRMIIGTGIAGLVAAAAVVLAPQAAARDLAPGLSCGESSCRNDSDEIYRVEATAVCSAGRYVDATTFVGPHRRADVVASCPADDWAPGYVIRIDYTRAVVDHHA
ncbi:hypothetical protein [Nocardia yamanashiensis]|uniref:hypothetical protein n=1 Tax=Nocardia yamanashiensis TaxID=209247 RepID=UPI000AB0AC9F|nr:hypothetical protein [Nocardia yamanashiensis]